MTDLQERVRALRLVAFDFDGVFTDNAVYVAEDGTEMVRCSRGDGFGLRKLERLGIHVIVLSTEEDPVVGIRCRKLKIPCVQGLQDKLAELEKLISEKGINLEQTAFVGNDINDLPCLRAVGLPIIVADAHPDVVDATFWQTKRRGGDGAVREICDEIANLLERGGD
ncbi:MAG: HAD hydrolase family protein [Chloroflexota bacterium]